MTLITEDLRRTGETFLKEKEAFVKVWDGIWKELNSLPDDEFLELTTIHRHMLGRWGPRNSDSWAHSLYCRMLHPNGSSSPPENEEETAEKYCRYAITYEQWKMKWHPMPHDMYKGDDSTGDFADMYPLLYSLGLDFGSWGEGDVEARNDLSISWDDFRKRVEEKVIVEWRKHYTENPYGFAYEEGNLDKGIERVAQNSTNVVVEEILDGENYMATALMRQSLRIVTGNIASALRKRENKKSYDYTDLDYFTEEVI